MNKTELIDKIAAGLEGICNERWGLEIHISYPEW